MVMEIRERTCIILTPDGEFREIHLPKDGVRLGQEISCVSVKKRYIWRYLVVAASFFILFGTGLLYHGWLNRAVAFVSMDINPSIELDLNRRQYVCAARGLNKEGEILLANAVVFGKPVEGALQSLLTEAVRANYLRPAKANVILATITPKDKRVTVLPDKAVYQSITKTLQSARVQAEVVVDQTTPEIRQQAQRVGLSTGRYLLHVESSKRGLAIGIEELKREGIANLEKKKHFTVREVLGKHGDAGGVIPAKPVSLSISSKRDSLTPLPPGTDTTGRKLTPQKLPDPAHRVPGLPLKTQEQNHFSEEQKHEGDKVRNHTGETQENTSFRKETKTNGEKYYRLYQGMQGVREAFPGDEQ